MNTRMVLVFGLFIALLTAACGGKDQARESESTSQESQQNEAVVDEGKGIGPITDLELPASIDQALAAQGAEIFKTKCTACHKMDTRHVGPPLAGVTEKRKPEWIMNMILNPDQMLKEDEAAHELLKEYLTPMTNQNITEEDARALLEYLRQADKEA